MADKNTEPTDLKSLRTVRDDEIVTERRVPRRSFLSSTGALLAGAAGVVAGVRAASAMNSPQQQDPDKKPADPDKPPPDSEKKDPDREKKRDPDKEPRDPDKKPRDDDKKPADPDKPRPADPDKPPPGR